MKKSRFSLILLLLSCASIHVQAEEAEYNSTTKELSIPGLILDDDTTHDIKMKLTFDRNSETLQGDFVISDIADVPSKSKCPAKNATNFSKIHNGMSLEEVNSTIGCEGVLQKINLNDGPLKSQYLWSFNNTSSDASILLFFENNFLIL